MSGHVWAWVAGFGWTVMPHAPFRFEREAGDARVVRVIHFTPDGAREATLSIDNAGEAGWVLGPGTERLEEVAELIPGPAYAHWPAREIEGPWRVETSVLTTCWPDGFALESTSSARPPFDLVGTDEMRVWIQGPTPEAGVPPPEGMAAPGQQLRAVVETPGGLLVELAYRHEGADWRQLHCRVDRNPPAERGRALARLFRRAPERYLCIVSGQAPEVHAMRLREAVVEVAASLTPCPPEP